MAGWPTSSTLTRASSLDGSVTGWTFGPILLSGLSVVSPRPLRTAAHGHFTGSRQGNAQVVAAVVITMSLALTLGPH